MIVSQVRAIAKGVPFPSDAVFREEMVYMRPIARDEVLPSDLRHWQPTLDAMLAKVPSCGKIYLTIDRRRVPAGATHRRPGAHIDGYWDGVGHRGHKVDFSLPYPPQALILASDVCASVAYRGRAATQPGDGGNCEHVDVSALEKVRLEANIAWAGDTMHMLHDSLRLPADTERSLVRLNVDGWLSS